MIASLGIVISVFVLSAWLTRRFCDPASRWHILDHPNERSLHTQPTPRSGGIAIVAGLLAGYVLGGVAGYGAPAQFWLLAALLPVATISFLDDRSGVPVSWRFAVHGVGAAALVWGAGLIFQAEFLPGLGVLRSSGVGALFALVYIVWMINLYNFMDGMDGFAGGMAVVGFGTFAVLGGMAGHGAFTFLSLVVAASAGGFLLSNFPPARIFMGDVGSSVLGLLAAALSLWGARDGMFPFWVALLVFSPFIVDATVTLLRRFFHGERVWQAHRTHYYQRLVQLGWGHQKTVVYEYGLMVACSASALLAVHLGSAGQRLIALGWCGLYLVLMAAVTWREKKRTG